MYLTLYIRRQTMCWASGNVLLKHVLNSSIYAVMCRFISHFTSHTYNLLNKCLFPLHVLVFSDNMLMPSVLLFTDLCFTTKFKGKTYL